jgi:hypothetical protein
MALLKGEKIFLLETGHPGPKKITEFYADFKN